MAPPRRGGQETRATPPRAPALSGPAGSVEEGWTGGDTCCHPSSGHMQRLSLPSSHRTSLTSSAPSLLQRRGPPGHPLPRAQRTPEVYTDWIRRFQRGDLGAAPARHPLMPHTWPHTCRVGARGSNSHPWCFPPACGEGTPGSTPPPGSARPGRNRSKHGATSRGAPHPAPTQPLEAPGQLLRISDSFGYILEIRDGNRLIRAAVPLVQNPTLRGPLRGSVVQCRLGPRA